MIKKLEVEDIVKILHLKDDDFNNLFVCEKGEWVQFLIQNADNEDFFMYGYEEEGKLIGYLIAYFISLPICKGVSVLYSKTAGLSVNKKVLEKLKDWAILKKAKTIDIITNNVVGHSIYGFEKTGTTMAIKL